MLNIENDDEVIEVEVWIEGELGRVLKGSGFTRSFLKAVSSSYSNTLTVIIHDSMGIETGKQVVLSIASNVFPPEVTSTIESTEELYETEILFLQPEDIIDFVVEKINCSNLSKAVSFKETVDPYVTIQLGDFNQKTSV